MTGFDNIEHASATDVGVRRSHNQDNRAILLAYEEEQWHNQGHVFVVADGMGGHAVGELASKLAADIIPHTYHKYAMQGAIPALRKAFQEANASIHARGQANREFEGMGTTATTLLLRPEGAWVGHVGDSRAYRIRRGKIEQLSYDHSFVWEVARQKGIDPDKVDGPSNVLIRSMGPVPLVQTDVEGPHPVLDGDIYLLCSDGLSGLVTDQEMGAVASILSPAEACRCLVDLANVRGGPDNITVIIIRVGKEPPADQPPPPRPRRPFRWPVPWPMVALTVGILLESWATYLMMNREFGGVALFILAALIIIAGLFGLMVHIHRERQRVAKEGEPRELHVYRQTFCRVDLPLVDKFARTNQTLKQRAQEQGWEVDWVQCQQHLDLAEKQSGIEDLTGAFREYCRAMHLLMESSQRGRNSQQIM